jgi:hypothetical protein
LVAPKSAAQGEGGHLVTSCYILLRYLGAFCHNIAAVIMGVEKWQGGELLGQSRT